MPSSDTKPVSLRAVLKLISKEKLPSIYLTYFGVARESRKSPRELQLLSSLVSKLIRFIAKLFVGLFVNY